MVKRTGAMLVGVLGYVIVLPYPILPLPRISLVPVLTRHGSPRCKKSMVKRTGIKVKVDLAEFLKKVKKRIFKKKNSVHSR